MDKRNAQILLLSDSQEEYQDFVNAGYKNITWISSILKARQYFHCHKEQFRLFDVVLYGHHAFKSFPYFVLLQEIFNEEEKANIPGLRFVRKNDRYNINGKNFSKEEFMFYIESYFPEKLKDKQILLSRDIHKRKIFPRKKKDLKILFFGYSTRADVAEIFFEEQGFFNYRIVESTNFSLGNEILEIPYYDLVISDASYNGSLIHLKEEYHELLKSSNKVCFFVDYESGPSMNLGRLIQLEATDTSSLQLKTLEYNTMEDIETSYKEMLGSIMNLYYSFHFLDDAKWFKSKEEIEKKCEDDKDKLLLYLTMFQNRLHMLIFLDNTLQEYRRYVEQGITFPKLEGLDITILSDAMSVAFTQNNIELARITFKDEDKQYIPVVEFYIQTRNQKGFLSSMQKKSFYDEKQTLSSRFPLATAREMQCVEGIYKKVKQELHPRLLNIREQLEENPSILKKEAKND